MKKLSTAKKGLLFLCFLITTSGCATIPQLGPRYGTHFSDGYIQEHGEKVFVEIPEVFELSNIAWALAKSDQESDPQTFRDGQYYRDVLAYFSAYKEHPLIQELSQGEVFADYFPFRTNSSAYVFEGDRIVHGGIYANTWQPDVFTKNLENVEDFAIQSGFRAFYKDHLPYYQEQIDLYNACVPVRAMWTWLEERFPTRYGSYKILFSPLIYASHNTQSFADGGFTETVMYVAGPQIYRSRGLDEEVEAGLLARIVFTEIDHNYIHNDLSQYKEEIKEAFADIDVWNGSREHEVYYNPKSTFAEYYTWALFILYAHDAYSPEAYDEITAITIELMQDGRGFIRFGDFSRVLLDEYLASPGQSISDSLPVVLEWAAGQAQ